MPDLPDTLPERLDLLLRSLVEQAMTCEFDTISDLDLSISQARILLVLALASEARSIHALATAVSISVPAASRAVDGLVRAGLVDRREGEVDRRVKLVELSAAGIDLMEARQAQHLHHVRAFSTRLSPEAAELLHDALGAVLADLAANAPERPAPGTHVHHQETA